MTIALVACNKNGLYQTENIPTFKIIDGRKELVGQKIKTFELPAKRIQSELTQIYNYNDDARLESLGCFKKDGLKDYLLDSVFYDAIGNDTLKISFLMKDKKWTKVQSVKKRYNHEGHIEYLVAESLKGTPAYKKETFCKYYTSGLLSSETEFECYDIVGCDSTFKKMYYYNSKGVLDSIEAYKWKNREWAKIES